MAYDFHYSLDGETMKLLLCLLLAVSIQAKTIERSCPVCWQCEPYIVELTFGDGPKWVCQKTEKQFVGYQRISCRGDLWWLRCDTLKWVPRDTKRPPLRSDTMDSTQGWSLSRWILPATVGGEVADTLLGEHPNMIPPDKPKKRKCVDEIDTTFVRMLQLSTGKTVISGEIKSIDTTFCNCDGDSKYWKMVITEKVCPERKALKCCDSYPDTLFTRIPSRWKKVTTETWVKKKKVLRDVWE